MLSDYVGSYPSTKPCFTNLLAGKSIRKRFSNNAGSGSGEVNVYSKNYENACKLSNFGGGLCENSLGTNDILLEKKQGACLHKKFTTQVEMLKEKRSFANREHRGSHQHIQLPPNAGTLIPGIIRGKEKYNSCAS